MRQETQNLLNHNNERDCFTTDALLSCRDYCLYDLCVCVCVCGGK